MHRRALTLFFTVGFLLTPGCGDEEPKNRPVPESELPTPPPPEQPKPDDAGSGEEQPKPEDKPTKPNPRKTPPAKGAAPKSEEPAEPKKFSEAELMTLVGLSATESQNAYGHCREILAQGIYDRYQENVSDTVKHSLAQQFCAMAEDEFTEKIQQYYKEKQGSSSSGSHSDSLGLDYMNYIGLDFSTSGSSAGSSSRELERAAATATMKKWKSANCGESSSSQSSDFEHTVLSERIDEDVIAAWRACVSQESHGFFCESSETEDTVSVRMRWDPNAVQSRLLPVLNLKQQTAVNLELASDEMPRSVGTGSGVSVTYRRVDPDRESVFEAQGFDPYHQVDFNCSIQVRKVVRGEIKADPSCKVKEFVAKRDALCGVELYTSARRAPCAAETYKTKASAACGVNLYNRRTDPACPGYASPDTQTLTSSNDGRCTGDAPTPDSCPAGYMDLGVTETTRECVNRRMDVDWTEVYRKTRTCQRAEFVATCRLPEFGVESYKSCAHPSHGVQTYRACRHSSFGVERYKECRKREFGEIYNTCFVPFD